MPEQIYELIAQGARYWFLLLMALITWRTFRWYRHNRRQYRKHLRLVPNAGFVGELVLLDEEGRELSAFPLPREGTLGSARSNDIRLNYAGVARRHLWFRFEDGLGVEIMPFRGKSVFVDGRPAPEKGDPLCMLHGSLLTVQNVSLFLRLYTGFESVPAAETAYPPEAGSGWNGQSAPQPWTDAGQTAAPAWNMPPEETAYPPVNDIAPAEPEYAPGPEPAGQPAFPPENVSGGVFLTPAEYAAYRSGGPLPEEETLFPNEAPGGDAAQAPRRRVRRGGGQG